MILKNIVFFCLKILLTFTNSVDTDEMQYYAEMLHLGLHCLQKYSFRGFPNTRVDKLSEDDANLTSTNINAWVELHGPRRKKTCLRGFANNTGADQPVHPHSLISTFVIRILESTIFNLATGKISIF